MVKTKNDENKPKGNSFIIKNDIQIKVRVFVVKDYSNTATISQHKDTKPEKTKHVHMCVIFFVGFRKVRKVHVPSPSAYLHLQ